MKLFSKNKLILFLTLIFTLSGFINLNAQNKKTDWAQFYRYEKANLKEKSSLKKVHNKKPLIILFGDSITDLWIKNSSDFFSSNNLLCRGISGQTTSEMLVRFRKDVLELNPKSVVILAGTNDIAENLGPIALDNILGNIISMCELAKVHKIRPIICSVLPCSYFSWRGKDFKPQHKIIELNQLLKDYASKNKINYIDYHSAMTNSDGGLDSSISNDGCHPNKNGYEIMESILLNSRL